MKQKVTIRVINEKVSGISQVNGKPWTIQKLHLSWEEPFDESHTTTQLVIVTLRGEDLRLWEERNLQVGDVIDVDLHFYPRTSGKFVDNEVTMRLL